MCNLKQGYTQYGGLRPFGVSLLYAGWDPHYEFQLYHSDPSGNYSGWKATCIGANNGTAQSLLKQEYKDEITLEEAVGLVLKTLSKTMDSTTLGSEKCECFVSFFFSHAISYVYDKHSYTEKSFMLNQQHSVPLK